MKKQIVLRTLQDALNDTQSLEQQLRALLRDQGLDAPYGVVSALGRLEQVREDLSNALDDLKESLP